MSYTYLWVGIALATVAVFAIFQSVLAAGYYSTQAARHEALAEAVSARKDLERRLSQETNSRNLDQGDYDTFMAMVAADNAAAYQDLEQYNNEQTEIPDDVAARWSRPIRKQTASAFWISGMTRAFLRTI